MRFPEQDSNWTKALDFLHKNKFSEEPTIAPIEFCNELVQCDAYEWSYWKVVSDYKVVVVHKGMCDRLKNDFLDDLEADFDYVYGNSVFNVYVDSSINKSQLSGVSVHLSLSSLIESLKKLVKSNKQFKANKKEKNILLVTANNSGNIGDDAITLASKDLLEAAYPDAKVVIDKGPASKELIRKVDLVVLGGGGIFYDSNFYNALNYCQYLLFAHEAGVKTIGMGIGAQGIKSDAGRELFKRAVDSMEYILVRDDYSQEILVEEVKTTTEVILSRDVVFSFDGKGEKYKVEKKTNKPLLLFSLLDSSKMIRAKATANYHANQAVCMEILNKKFEVKLFVQSRDDLELYNSLQEKYDLDIIELGFNHTRKVVDVYNQADLVITSRLHGFIFSAISRTPVISLSAKNGKTKLGSLIYKYIPSAQKGNLVLKDYSPELLNAKLELYQQEQGAFKLDETEVLACEHLAKEILSILKNKHIDI